MSVIRVDIDGTICVTEGENYPNAVPMKDRIATVNALYDKGHTIIYWTARGAVSEIDWYEETKAQLDLWGCKYHTLLMDKPAFDMFIDDKVMNAIELNSYKGIKELNRLR